MERKATPFIKISFLLLQLIFVWSQTAAQQLDWVQQIGSNKKTGADNMVTDGEGHLYVLGYFEDSIFFNSRFQAADTLPASNPNGSMFLAKFDTAGHLIWRKEITGQEYLNKVACLGLDRSGNIFLAGGFTGTIEFQTLSGIVSLSTLTHPNYNLPVEGFICKLNSAGDYIWAKKIGEGSRGFSPLNLTTDNAGNVILAGNFSDSADLDPGSGNFMIHGDPGSVDIFICKLDGNGNFLWGGKTGDFWVDRTLDMTTDAQDNIFITGYFGGAADFDIGSGTHVLVAFGLGDIFVWKLRSNGTLDWVKQFGSPAMNDWGAAIHVDDNGFIYLAGCYESQLDLSGGSSAPFISKGDRDIFVCKLDNQGNYIWGKSMGGAKRDVPFDLTLDQDGYIYLTGSFTDTAVFGTGPDPVQLVSNGGHDMFICKFDNDGNQLWGRSIGAPNTGYKDDYGNAIFVDQQRSIYVAGGFKGSADFDPGNGTHILSSLSGSADGYLLKLLCSDDKTWLIRDSFCKSYTFHNNTYTESGVYYVTLQNVSGCDSIAMELDLEIIEISPAEIQVNGNVASTTHPYASYQWYKNGIIERDSVNSTYTITENGDYTVVVTNEYGCTDTSDIYPVNNVSISDRYIHSGIRIYPNPAKEALFIDSPIPYRIRITDIQGRTVAETKTVTHTIPVGHLKPGMYHVYLIGANGDVIQVQPVVKE